MFFSFEAIILLSGASMVWSVASDIIINSTLLFSFFLVLWLSAILLLSQY